MLSAPVLRQSGTGVRALLHRFAPLSGILVILFLTHAAFADLPAVRFDRLTPLGASVGTTVDAEIAGADIEEVKSLWFEHPGLSAVAVEGKDKHFRISVAADVPAGTYDVRLVGRWGISNPRLFAVTRGLKDIVEIEPNNEKAKAQLIQVNSAVAGMSDGNNEDVFVFRATAKQRIVIDCQAGKLDSQMDATMALASADGKTIATSSDYNGRDPLIAFIAPADGDYILRVFDLSYRGGHPYRLLVTDKPYVMSLSPRVVQTGKTVEMTVIGHNLGAKASRSTLSIEDGLPFDELRFSYTARTDVVSKGTYQFREHPTDHSVLPTAATSTLTGVQIRPPFDDVVNSFPVVVTDSPVILEAEPNNDKSKPQIVALPLSLSGRFDSARDADWFEFEVKESGSYAIDVYCERIRGYADPYVVIVDDQEKRVQEFDDFGHRINAFDGHLRDPVGTINLTEKKKYRALVQDRYRRGGNQYQYVLSIRKAEPDFQVAVIHSVNPGPAATNLWRGGAAYLDVVVNQQEGFNGEIVLAASDLPGGVHATPMVVNNNSRGVFVLWADENAADFAGPIKLIATAKRGNEILRHEVRAYTRVWSSGLNSTRPTRDLIISVRDGSPFRLECLTDRVEVEAGKPIELKLRLVRRWADFKGDVTIKSLTFPNNFSMSDSAFKGKTSEIALAINTQGNLQPGQYTLVVIGQAQVPFNKDPKAKDKPNTLVSLPSRPVNVIVKAKAK